MGIVGDGRQQHFEAVSHALDGFGVKEVSIVIELASNAVTVLDDAELKVVSDGADVETYIFNFEP